MQLVFLHADEALQGVAWALPHKELIFPGAVLVLDITPLHQELEVVGMARLHNAGGISQHSH